jgi:chromosome segregation ATPase
VKNAAQTDVATSAVPSPSLVNTSLTCNSGVAPQQSPSKPALWAAWGVAAARSPSPLTATHTVVNGGVASSSFRVSCEDMALPLPTGPQPAPIPHPANVSTAEGPAAVGSEEIEMTKDPGQVQTAKQNSCSSGHAPSSVLQPLVAADAEVLIQLRQALDQISELNVNQRAALAREMELQRDTAALRAHLQNELATLQAREAELQETVVHFADLQSAPQGWKRREAELLGVVAAQARTEESHRNTIISLGLREEKLTQERDALARFVEELQTANEVASQHDANSARATALALQARDAGVTVLQAREAELHQARARVLELENIQRTAQAREAQLKQENMQFRQHAEQARAEQTADREVARLQSERDSATAARDAALVTAAAAAHSLSGAPTQLQRVSELEHDMQQFAHDYELQRQDRDAQREVASAARRRLLEVQRSARDDKKVYEEQLRELQREAETLREQLHSRDNVILEATQSELLSAQKDKAALREELQNAEQRVKKSEGQRAAVDARLRKQNAALSSQNAVLVSEKDTLQQRLDRLTAEMQRPAS